MRLSFVIGAVWAVATGSHVLVNSMPFNDYDLVTRNYDLEDFNARSFYEPYLDIEERDLSYEDLDTREDMVNDLWERDMFAYYLADFVARDEEESTLQLRYNDKELEARDFFDDETDFVTREDGLEDEILSREPLRYRIGVVVHPHEN